MDVGIRKRKHRHRRKEKGVVRVMGEKEEAEFLSMSSRSNKHDVVKKDWWIPPPPFSMSSRKDVACRGWKENGGVGSSFVTTKRLPVQFYGSSKVIVSESSSSSSSAVVAMEREQEQQYYDKEGREEEISLSYQFIFPKNRSKKSKNIIPEIAIIGRSNVGKSTLLNALLYGNHFDEMPEGKFSKRGRRKQPVKIPKGIKASTSDRPGETTDIMFYKLSCIFEEFDVEEGTLNLDRKNDRLKGETTVKPINKSMMSMFLVDLPGYGFSYAKEEKKIRWRQMMHEYIINRGSQLKRVLLLLDARHGFKKEDVSFINDLQGNLRSRETLPPIQIVLTKCDLVPQEDLARQVVAAKRTLSDLLKREPSILPVMLVSAKSGLGYNNVHFKNRRLLGGILELQRELASIVPKPNLYRNN